MSMKNSNSLRDLELLLVKQYQFLGDFSFSKSASMSGNDTNQGTLNLCMMDREGASVHLQFQGVRNVEIKTGPYKEINIVGMVCDDMSGDQWPGVYLRLSSEDGPTHLSFYCSDAAVITEPDTDL